MSAIILRSKPRGIVSIGSRAICVFSKGVALGFLVAAFSGCGGGAHISASSGPRDNYPDIATPKVSGPIANEPLTSQTKNYQFFASDVALASKGYVEEEFFVEGKAKSYDTPEVVYTPVQPPSTLAKIIKNDVPYKTRIVVRRPSDPAKFNGTVVIEWLNVTDGFDGEYFWVQAKDYLLRAGYAYIAVAAQDHSISVSKLSLKKFSPIRYGSLDVTGAGTLPNDDLSYDIFSQTAKAARNVPSVMKGMTVKKVMAVGMSQGGARVGTYTNYVHMRAPIYDSFLLQVNNTLIRDDFPAPLIKVVSESEAKSDQLQASQADTPTRRTWWVAGSTHGDATQRLGRTGVRLRDLGLANTGNDSCAEGVTPTRSRTPFRHVVNAAVYHLQRQMESGALPPQGPQFKTSTSGTTMSVARDSAGNALGGIRLAHADVPTARANGIECGAPGAWVPFTSSVLNTLYPTHAGYVAKVTAAVNASVSAGFVLPEDAAETIAEANASVYGSRLECGLFCLSSRHFRDDFSSTGLLRDHTVYYNTLKGDDLIQAIDEAHIWVAKGYSQPAGSSASRDNYKLGIAALQRYSVLVTQAKSENRMTATAADLLIKEANNIIRGLQAL